MSVIICPGIHPPELTEHFLAGLGCLPAQLAIFPADRHPAYSGYHILKFLQEQPQEFLSQPLLFVGFSAGVVGAVGAAFLWEQMGHSVKALIALDGWGVPLFGHFPTHRMSHDPFTHWSSTLLGGNGEGFYADPSVSHLDLWRSPQTAQGWRVQSCSAKAFDRPSQLGPSRKISAATFLNTLLIHYEEI